jgi:hypothetical protein
MHCSSISGSSGALTLPATLVDINHRLPCSVQILASVAAQYRDPAFVLDGWVPYTVNATPAGITPGPMIAPVADGTMVTVNWRAPSVHSAQDVIVLSPASLDVSRRLWARDPDGRPLSRQDVGAGTTGTLSFILPNSGALFEFRYLRDDGPQVAVSNLNGPLPPCDPRDADDDRFANVVDESTCIEH